MQTGGDTAFVGLVRRAYSGDARAGELTWKNNFYLERGPYDIISVLDENKDSKPYVVWGPVIDLFDPTLPALGQKTVQPGEQSVLYDLSRVADKQGPRVLAAASRTYDAKATAHSYAFVARSPVNTENSMRVLLPARPVRVDVTDAAGHPLADVRSSWDEVSHTEYLGFANSPEGVRVRLSW